VGVPRGRSGLAWGEQGRLVDGKVDGMVDVILPRVHGSGCIWEYTRIDGNCRECPEPDDFRLVGTRTIAMMVFGKV
jgi:hypothetical protein